MRKSIPFILVSLFLLAAFAAARPAAAQVATPEPPIIIEPPLPPVWDFGKLRIDYQRVNVTVDNQIATTRVDMLFVNDNDWMLEGQYFFPLPAGATVTELTMWIDGTPIESKILRKEEARAIYDRIVSQLRDPALLEYVGQDAIQANVFPIPAHDERRIEIEYRQVLPADGGLIHYVFPQSTRLYTNLPLDEQSIRVEIRSREAIRTLYSPTHRVDISRDGEFRAVAGYEAANVTADTDFDLYYTVSPEEIGLNVLSFKEAGQDGFFMLLAAPSVEVDPSRLVARDILLVLDTSGSMEGEKMAQAKAAVRTLIDQLNPTDRFNIITFSTGVRSYLPRPVPAGDAGDYAQFINSIEALGGTNISEALLAAVAQVDSQRPATIIFLTDGLATEGITDTQALIGAVARETPRSVRIFAFGVGDDVDTFLLDSITGAHRGTTGYVRPFERIDEEIQSFYTKISTPVLADISLDFDGVRVEQLYPSELPDLFAGTQLVLVGRYRQGGPARITLTGEVNGETTRFVYEDNRFRGSGGDDFIPRLWATRAIGSLLNEIRLKGESTELVESVVNLSIRYGIITPYTSYLIEEDDIFSQTGRERIVESEVSAAAVEGEEVVGEAAVDRADAFGSMSEAEAPAMAPLPTAPSSAGAPAADAAAAQKAAQTVRFVGSKTFVLRGDRWIDTGFDEAMAVEQVGFGSEIYFELLSAAPELGRYFALGERVVVVYDGRVYEVVPGAGSAEVTLPEVTVPESAPEVPAAPVNPPAGVSRPPVVELDAPPTSPALLILAGGVVALLLFALLFTLRRR